MIIECALPEIEKYFIWSSSSSESLFNFTKEKVEKDEQKVENLVKLKETPKYT